jgi:biotin transport system substrate-specific component
MTTPSTVTRASARSMAQVSLFAALMAVMGLIPKIDLPLGVPMLLFLAAVAVGLPLLSGGRGGIAVFMAPSAGYLLGYPLAACIAGLVMRALPQGSPRRAAFSAFAASALGGLLALHAFGVLGLMLMAKLSLSQAFMATLLFVPGDLIKCVLCALIVHTVARGMPDWPFGGRQHG